MSLTISRLTKFFDKKCIIKDFSYHFNSTGIYAIRGESGIGKTTLLRIIAGLDNDYTGSILGGGIGRVGFAFQEHRLFPQLSGLENVVFSISDRKDEAVYKKATTLLSRLGLSGEDILLTPAELSGGMKQRISLARAFISPYPIILLDEPTKELDARNSSAVLDIISELSKTKLIILVSHNDDDMAALSATEIHLQKT